MRIIGLLSWYDEPAPWLAECVTAAARLCDHLVAVDGAYAAFPGALRWPTSRPDQAETIARAAAGAGIGVTVHTPDTAWWDGEVGKRDFMFQLGMTLAEPGKDWFLRIDADEVVTCSPGHVRQELAATGADVAEVMITDRESINPLRVLFRALPGIGIRQAHYVVTAPGPDGDTRVLAGDDRVHDLEPVEPLWDVRLEHRTHLRDPGRREAKQVYYRQLPDIERVEAL